MKESPEALSYRERRGPRSAELVERFQLGFSNRTLAYRLPPKGRQTGAELRGRLQVRGVLRESGHEHMNGSLVVPTVDEAGRVAEMYGRKITPGLRPGTPQHMHLPGPHRGVWNAESLGSSATVILCEALIDAMTFWCAGFRNVTASYGVERFTAERLAALKKHGTERVLVAYDRDEAGDRAACLLAEKLTSERIECFRVLFPKGMDADEYAQMTPAPKALDVVLPNAQWLGKGAPKASLVIPSPVAPAPTTRAAAVDGRDASEPAVAAAAETRAYVGAQASDEALPVVAEAPPPFVADLPAACEATAAARPRSHEVAESEDEVTVRLADRKWRVRGLSKNTRLEAMKVNVLVARDDGGFHVNALELYSARERAAYIALAASELGVEERVIKKDLGELLLKLEKLHEKKLASPKDEREPKRPKLTDDEERAALALLRDPKLLDRILDDFELCGVVGERMNMLVGYLAATSRKLEQPLPW